MNSAYKTAEPFPEIQRKDISRVEMKLFINKTTMLPRIKRKKTVADTDEFIPVEILSTYWSDWNEADIIKYKTVNGEIYIIQDDTLLRNVVKFMDEYGFTGLHPWNRWLSKETSGRIFRSIIDIIGYDITEEDETNKIKNENHLY